MWELWCRICNVYGLHGTGVGCCSVCQLYCVKVAICEGRAVCESCDEWKLWCVGVKDC